MIIMLTSMGMRGDAGRCKELGVEGYMVKPVKQRDLFEALMLVCEVDGKDPSERESILVTKHVVREEQQKRRLKILLVEDNYINQQVAVKFLEKQDHYVTVADDGKKGLERLEKGSFDLVLMDVQMPVMDGLTATHQIRKSNASWGKIPIIAMTAHAMKGDREKCLEAGMDDYISKPIDPQKLNGLLSKWGGASQAASEMPENPSEPVSGGFDDSLLDLKKALVRTNGDKEFLEEMIQYFLGSVPEQIAALSTTLESGDEENLTKQAHTLKGAAATLGANRIASVARRLEMMSRDGELADGSRTIVELADELASLNEFVGQIDWASIS